MTQTTQSHDARTNNMNADTNNDKVLLLRTCDRDGQAYGGFQWPLEVGAEVVAPDWTPAKVCGGGLHGLLFGEGDAVYLSGADDAKWMVVEANRSDLVDLGGKVKVPRFDECDCTVKSFLLNFVSKNVVVLTARVIRNDG